MVPLCWLPEDLQDGQAFGTHGTTVVIGTYNGTLTIMDLSGAVRSHLTIT
jgi:hypothetical protein